MIAWSDFLLVIAVAIGTVGVIYSIHSVFSRQRAERNLQIRLDDADERDELAEAILEDPSQANIERGRRLVVRAVSSLSEDDRRQIGHGLYQPQMKGRNAYIATVVAGKPKLRNRGLTVRNPKRRFKLRISK